MHKHMVVLLLAVAVGCNSGRSASQVRAKEKRAPQVSDQEIRNNVQDALIALNSPTIVCFAIGCGGEVIVNDGRVTLLGSAVSEGDRLIAEKTAKTVPGVKEVVNKLGVWPQATVMGKNNTVEPVYVPTWPFAASPRTAAQARANDLELRMLSDRKYHVLSKNGTNLGTFDTFEQASEYALRIVFKDNDMPPAAPKATPNSSRQQFDSESHAGMDSSKRRLAGSYYASDEGNTEKWDFSSNGSFTHEMINASRAWIAARRGTYVRKEEQGRYEISGNILVLHISDSVTNVVDNQLHGFSKGRARTPFMTSGQSSGPSTRQCEVRILGTGTIVIDGREFKARNNW